MSKKWKKAPPPPKSKPAIAAAGAPACLRICGASEPLELQALAAGEDGAQKLRKFSMVAYTGGLMRILGFGWPVVVDLEGMQVPSESRPILRDHEVTQIVGHTDSIKISQQRLKVAGVISGIGEAAQEVVQLAANGFPWQASIGASVERLEFVDRGETVKVNGKSFTGPIYVARATTLGEVSFVPIGADAATSASVTAQKAEGSTMNFEQWCQAKGFDAKTLTDQQKSALQAAFDAEQKTVTASAPTPAAQAAAAAVAAPAASAPAIPNVEDEVSRRVSAALLRTEKIHAICAKYSNPQITIGDGDNARLVSIEAHAIGEKWDENRTELECLRAARPTVHSVPGSGQNLNASADVIEAAICVSVGLPNVEKKFKPETLEAAHKRYRGIGLQQVLLMAAASNGYHAGPGARIHNGNIREVLQHAFSSVRAGFSPVSLPGILGNVANKELLAGYMEEDQTWREIAAVKSVSDFKQVTSYRLLDSMEYEEVGPGGEIKHGTVDQESYTRQAKTYAKMFALERTTIINDDLGAFDDLRTRLGRGAAQKFNNVFWTNMLANHSTFFTSTRTNYISGATTTLLVDGVGLGLAVKAFRQMKSPTADGSKRIGGRPEILLVPPELEQAAEQLFVAQNLATTSATLGPGNIYQGKYRPVVCAWLSDSNFTGYSTTAWYLFRNAGVAPMMTASFLDGVQVPTVESADADFNVLGVQFRGYHDFGCDQAEYLCGIKSKGAA